MSTASTPAPAPGQPIPTAPDFPVVWDDPRDAKLTWDLFPPIAPTPLLTFSFIKAFLVGALPSFERAGLPITIHMARINTYLYGAFAPKDAPPEMVLKGLGLLNRAAPGVFKLMMDQMAGGMSKKSEAALNPIVERFEAYWRDEILPEIKQHLAYFESCDLRGLSLDQLRAHLGEAVKRVGLMGALHGIILPSAYALSQFEEFYCEVFEGATTLDALQLTQGFDNKILEGDRALWRLSRAALATPEVFAILSAHAPAAVIPALEQSEAGRPFLADLRAWLAQYSQRLNSAFALGEPSWIEDPTPAIEYLQADLAQAEPRPGMDPTAMAAAREQAVAAARARLAGYPQPVVARFEKLLKAAQAAVVVLEDHNFWIDQRLFYHVRRVILEFGQRLAQAGALAAVPDVFHLAPEELQTSGNLPLRRLVAERQAEVERFSRVTPPPKLGTLPAFEMTGGGSVMRAMSKGELGARNTSRREANAVKGIAGSAGVVRGPARLIHSLAEAGRLRRGDVLVTKTTLPPWTPLFATAAAVVTDTGGVLCHSAVVAREYHIPAVVGTDYATSTFHDGQLLEVDGDAGTVRVVVEAGVSAPMALAMA